VSCLLRRILALLATPILSPRAARLIRERPEPSRVIPELCPCDGAPFSPPVTTVRAHGSPRGRLCADADLDLFVVEDGGYLERSAERLDVMSKRGQVEVVLALDA